MMHCACWAQPGWCCRVAWPCCRPRRARSVYQGDFWMLHQFDGATGAVLADPLGIPGGSVAADGEDLVLYQLFCQRSGGLESADREMSEDVLRLRRAAQCSSLPG